MITLRGHTARRWCRAFRSTRLKFRVVTDALAFMFDSVRTRLTLWYVAVLALSLIGFAFVVYYAAAGIFYERQDESLRSTAQTVASAYLQELEEEHSVAKANEV